jgi:pimeloyl-ACP methyl ester carboxylesterase
LQVDAPGTPWFVAGASQNAHAFDDFAPRFRDRHHVIGITRRGHGASSWPDSAHALATLVHDIRTVLDSLGVRTAILAGHSLARAGMTRLAADEPDRVVGLIYIDVARDLTTIGRVRLPQFCPFGPDILQTMERGFQNPEAFRRTQLRTGDDGVSRPYASESAVAQINGSMVSPDYSAVRGPALGVYYVPERIEHIFRRVATPSEECVSAFQRYIYGGIASFAEGVQRATVVALQNSQHNLHLESPDELEAVMRRWIANLTMRR